MFCEMCKISLLILSTFFTLSVGYPGQFYDSTHGLNPGSYSGGGGNSFGAAQYKVVESYAEPGEGLSNFGNDHQGAESHQGGGSSEVADYHHGVSVVGLGNQQKGPTFDLTKHGGGAHQGVFGGSFVASAKYGGHDDGSTGGGHGSHYTSIGGLGGHGEQTALLVASISDGGQNEQYHH
ncbi:hypothetical protein WA026_016337 [Henosepilachna vigintioctopunctata]|uniref:Uncharacterized protein n=1 Tax=Henosepilachna vigintioctopunctata TaxID=420089 RepID=A0AAW1UKX1_9CUCU